MTSHTVLSRISLIPITLLTGLLMIQSGNALAHHCKGGHANDPECDGGGGSGGGGAQVEDCTNGVDDDGDGYIDANDPGCEVGPNYWDEAAEPQEGFLTECADGLDNDGDTFIDADDPSCFNDVLGEPDGHLNDEAFEPAP